ncbi:unnamed protein product [Sphenostylis stenocarpa]|uniref:Uncharacterized protein n=1 Tax=Sphenostylis stenocarpa TaxID=92480 RepID=A0AA86VT12_9FABA|nr:unnamed protein product [Sphenostylis stenocarpa]
MGCWWCDEEGLLQGLVSVAGSGGSRWLAGRGGKSEGVGARSLWDCRGMVCGGVEKVDDSCADVKDAMRCKDR